MYVSDADGDEFTEVCLPVDLEDDGYNMVHTHDNYAAFVLAGAVLVLVRCGAVLVRCRGVVLGYGEGGMWWDKW